MGDGLPEGLVSNKEGVTAVVEGVDRVEAEQVAYLWSVYSSKKTVLAENIGRRLENFFWRIWSSERIRERLSGDQVSIQFDIINQGGYIRTTPTPSPRSSKSLNAYYREARLRTPPTTPPTTESSKQLTTSTGAGPLLSKDDAEGISVTPTPTSPSAAVEKLDVIGPSSSDNGPEGSSVTPTPASPSAAIKKSSSATKENRRTSTSTTRRPPILKKGSTGSSKSSKSAKIVAPSSLELQASTAAENEEAILLHDDPNLSTGIRSGSARRQTNMRFNEEVSVSIPKASIFATRSPGERSSSNSVGEGIQRPGKRNPVVVATTGAGKRRPTVMRQKSSQASSIGSRSSSSQNLARSPRPILVSTSAGSQSGGSSKGSPGFRSTSRARAASPHPLKEHRRPSPDPASSEEVSEDSDREDVQKQNPSPQSTVKLKFSEDVSEGSAGKQPEAPKSLVDPDFRAKFIGRTRASQHSLTDLSAFVRKSSTAVPTAASYQATGMMESRHPASFAGRGKGREAFTNLTAPLKAPAPAGPETTDDNNPEPLPRTKSQLTLLLEREKGRSANEERSARKSEP